MCFLCSEEQLGGNKAQTAEHVHFVEFRIVVNVTLIRLGEHVFACSFHCEGLAADRNLRRRDKDTEILNFELCALNFEL